MFNLKFTKMQKFRKMEELSSDEQGRIIGGGTSCNCSCTSGTCNCDASRNKASVDYGINNSQYRTRAVGAGSF